VAWRNRVGLRRPRLKFNPLEPGALIRLALVMFPLLFLVFFSDGPIGTEVRTSISTWFAVHQAVFAVPWPAHWPAYWPSWS